LALLALAVRPGRYDHSSPVLQRRRRLIAPGHRHHQGDLPRKRGRGPDGREPPGRPRWPVDPHRVTRERPTGPSGPLHSRSRTPASARPARRAAFHATIPRRAACAECRWECSAPRRPLHVHPHPHREQSSSWHASPRAGFPRRRSHHQRVGSAAAHADSAPPRRRSSERRGAAVHSYRAEGLLDPRGAVTGAERSQDFPRAPRAGKTHKPHVPSVPAFDRLPGGAHRDFIGGWRRPMAAHRSGRCPGPAGPAGRFRPPVCGLVAPAIGRRAWAPGHSTPAVAERLPGPPPPAAAARWPSAVPSHRRSPEPRRHGRGTTAQVSPVRRDLDPNQSRG